MELRLVMDLEGRNGYEQMAIDEATLELVARNRLPPTLRIWRFKPSTVSIGYFQRVHEVVKLDKARELGIDVVRRFTGGGAVFHDYEGEIVYSIAMPITKDFVDVAKSYERICSAIVAMLRKLGLNASFKPINDVVVQGKKVSGSAQARRGALLQHGTVMVSTRIEIMDQVLVPPPTKKVSSFREVVTTVNLELGTNIEIDRVARLLVESFEEILNAKTYRDVLGSEVISLARELEPKYRSEEWLFKR